MNDITNCLRYSLCLPLLLQCLPGPDWQANVWILNVNVNMDKYQFGFGSKLILSHLD